MKNNWLKLNLLTMLISSLTLQYLLFNFLFINDLYCQNSFNSTFQDSNIFVLKHLPFGPRRAVASKGKLLFSGIGEDPEYMSTLKYGGIMIYSVSDMNDFSNIANLELPNPVIKILLQQELAFIATKNREVFVMEYSNPLMPEILGSFQIASNQSYTQIRGMDIKNKLLALALESEGIKLFDITDPLNPAALDSFDTEGRAYDVAFDDSILVVADGNEGLLIFKITDQLNLELKGNYNTQGTAIDVELSESKAYVADDFNGLRIINIENLANPSEIGFYKDFPEISLVRLKDNMAICADPIDYYRQSSVVLIDITKPFDTKLLKRFSTNSHVNDLTTMGDSLFIGDSFGLDFWDISDPENAYRNTFFRDITYGDIAVYGDKAYLTGGSKLQIIDISQLFNPILLGRTSIEGYHAIFHGSQVSGNFMYVAAWDGGFRVLDISDPRHPIEVAKLYGSDYNDVFIRQDRAYIASDHSGLVIIDISNPLTPEIKSTLDVTDAIKITCQDKILFITNNTGLWAVDILDKDNPTKLGYIGIPGYAQEIIISNNFAFIGNMSFDEAGVDIIDISNPESMTPVSKFQTPNRVFSVSIHGDFLYAATENEGIRVADISNPVQPMETDYFKTDQGFRSVLALDSLVYAMNTNEGLYILRNPLDTMFNKPPTLSSIPEITFKEDDSLEVAIQDWYPYVHDPDNPDSSLSWSFDGMDEVNINLISGIVKFTSSLDWYGWDTVQVTVSDGDLSDADDLLVIVQPVNDPPTITGLPDSVVFADDASFDLNIWEFVEDIESPDNLLFYEFSTSNDSLFYHYNSESGILSLSAERKFNGTAFLNISVADDSNATATAQIKVVVTATTGVTTSTKTNIPQQYQLQQNYPNPFNPITHIRFGLPKSTHVQINIYNNLGQFVETIVDGHKLAGYHTIMFDARNLTSGIYFYQIITSEFQENKKMLLLR